MIKDQRAGFVYAITAFLLWGFFPIYWKLLQAVPPIVVLCHRVIWSLLFLSLIVCYQKRLRKLFKRLGQGVVLRTFTVSSLLLAFNWLVFIWAVNAGHILQASLGYFMTPLTNVLLGMIFLGETLRPAQKVAVGLAATAVLYMTINQGGVPWIALSLAITFGLYGLIRKTTELDSVAGLFIETIILLIPALFYILVYDQKTLHFLSASEGVLLALAGPVTAIPLLLFAAGARRLPLRTIGIAQYLSPTMQFIIGVAMYNEPLEPHKLIAFALIWTGIVIYSFDGLRRPAAVEVSAA